METITQKIIEYYVIQKDTTTDEESPMFYNQVYGTYAPTSSFEYAAKYTDLSKAQKLAKLLASLNELDEEVTEKFEYKVLMRTINSEYVEVE